MFMAVKNVTTIISDHYDWSKYPRKCIKQNPTKQNGCKRYVLGTFDGIEFILMNIGTNGTIVIFNYIGSLS